MRNWTVAIEVPSESRLTDEAERSRSRRPCCHHTGVLRSLRDVDDNAVGAVDETSGCLVGADHRPVRCHPDRFVIRISRGQLHVGQPEALETILGILGVLPNHARHRDVGRGSASRRLGAAGLRSGIFGGRMIGSANRIPNPATSPTTRIEAAQTTACRFAVRPVVCAISASVATEVWR